ncbi:hypothetical protein B0A52_01126 [Exophiala mesophila]|uniref:Major facilitator superfamily (MFS) profile domain-containing protein n=1 Tax=Exophiala mesophila TaxID=212818 RepID=A0A438NGJ3_EXOME|nr:hypothetical protein B0A52_01126 [Exophiala mesophila]
MSTCCALSFCMYGYDAGVLGGVQTTKPFLDAIGHPTGTYVIPMIASSYTLAAAVCSLAVSVLGMPLGRRGCILMGDGLVIVGAAIQASSWSVAQMIASRIICGWGIGFISCSVPTYMAEMSINEKERGPEVAVQCIWLISGVALAYWVDFGFTRMTNQVSWRFPIGFQAFFAVISIIGMFFMPDTPRWYYARGRNEEGDDVVARLHDRPVEDPAVQAMRNEILASIKLEDEDEHKFNVIDLFWDRSDLKAGRRIRISFMILSLQQMMGINLSVYYSTVIFAQLGLSPFLSQLLAAVMNTGFALGTVPLPWVIERLGRRRIMIWSAVALTAFMTVFVAMIGLPSPSTATQYTAVACIACWNFIFGFAFIGIPWLYGPEIAPLKLRHLGGAAGAFGEWLFSFITVFAGGIALQEVGWKIWLWMLLSCAAAVPFVYFLCPETTGKTLEEIDLIFAKPEIRDSALAARTIRDHAYKEGVLKEVSYEEKE